MHWGLARVREARGGGGGGGGKGVFRSCRGHVQVVDWHVNCNAGEQNGLALPYRGQFEPNLPSEEELQHVPAGVCRDVLLRSCMVRGQITTNGPSHHAGLGLDGYVQFTSPIRRYVDMLAHFQLKVCACTLLVFVFQQH